jgi:CRISPR-associated protein Csb3
VPHISFPVDLWNPSQVFACLGILEAAQQLAGPAKGNFNWKNGAAIVFEVRTAGSESPLRLLFEFLQQARVSELRPPAMEKSEDENAPESAAFEAVQTFPARAGNPMALPVHLISPQHSVVLSHWADETREDSFKLYAGNRSAYGITKAMLEGVRKAPKKNQTIGDIQRKGVQQLWAEQPEQLLADPFSVVTPLGGSFNFDARRAWTAIDAGYSPNQQKTPVSASPLVELMAAWGLEHARPLELSTRKYCYSAWATPLAPVLARTSLAARLPHLPGRVFEFELAMSGKDKVVNYAEERRSQ